MREMSEFIRISSSKWRNEGKREKNVSEKKEPCASTGKR